MTDAQINEGKYPSNQQDVEMSDQPSSGLKDGVFDQNDIMSDIEHKKISMRRKSSVRRAVKMESTTDLHGGEMVFSREDSQMDVSKFKFEDYKIIKKVGSGTFGKVYLVKNVQINKFFAMKSIRKDVVLQHESLESLKVEKLILLQVQHPFIISMEQVFSTDTRIYFVM